MNLSYCIRRINNALEDLGQKKAYDIKWPKYNYRGYCMGRIVAGTVALGLGEPTDVPCWDLELDRYVPGEFFWKLWAWNLNNQGEPERDLEDHVDDHLNLPCMVELPGGSVQGQVAVMNQIKEKVSCP